MFARLFEAVLGKSNPHAATPTGSLNTNIESDVFTSAAMPEGRGPQAMEIASDLLTRFAGNSSIWRAGVERQPDEQGRPVLFVKYTRGPQLSHEIVDEIQTMAFPYKVNLYQQNRGEHSR